MEEKTGNPAVKERPMLFSAPMVRALLDGSKTQTRRALKVQMVYGDVCGMFSSWYLPNKAGTGGTLWPNGKEDIISMCPHGQPGDRIWVRETWRGVVTINPPECAPEYGVARYVPDREHCKRVEYAATQDRDDEPWRPSIHMPRWASRIQLEIVAVRVERLNACSDVDAVAEGIGLNPSAIGMKLTNPPGESMAIAMYRALWDSINGAGSWAANPWVWVVEFKRVTP